MGRCGRPFALATLLFGGGACDWFGGDQEDAAAPTATTPASPASADANATPPPTEVSKPTAPSVFVPELLKEKMPDDFWDKAEFLGWSPGGEVFALKLKHDESSETHSQRLEVVEVIDSLSGLPIRRVTTKASASDGDPGDQDDTSLPSSWSAYVGEAKGSWPEIEKSFSTHGAPPPGVEISFKAGKAPAGSVWRFSQEGDRAKWKWVWEVLDEDGESVDVSMRESDAPKGNISVRVRLSTGREKSQGILTKRIDNELAECGELSGEIESHWSPDGNRVLLLVKQDGACFDHGEWYCPCGSRSWFVRSLGKHQLRLTDGGAGSLATRDAARRLDASDKPVAVLDAADEPVATSKVYYRGEGQAYAAEVAGALGIAVAEEPLEKRGWNDVIVVLGENFSTEGPSPTPLSLAELGVIAAKQDDTPPVSTQVEGPGEPKDADLPKITVAQWRALSSTEQQQLILDRVFSGYAPSKHGLAEFGKPGTARGKFGEAARNSMNNHIDGKVPEALQPSLRKHGFKGDASPDADAIELFREWFRVIPKLIRETAG